MASNISECLFLSESDLVKVGSLNMEQCIDTMEEAYSLVGQGDYIMGGASQNDHGHKIFFPSETPFTKMPTAAPDRRFASLIGYLGGEFHVAGMKWYGSNIKNRELGLPRSILTIALNDPDTAELLSVMSGNTISSMRTGAMPGLAAKHLAKEDSQTIGLIGAGVVNRTSLKGLSAVLKDIKQVKVYDLFAENSKKFAEEMGDKLKLKIESVKNIEEVINNSDIVNIATSGKNNPHIKKEWLKEGALLSLPARVDLDDDILLNSKIVVDEWKMHKAYHNQGKIYDKAKDFQTAYLFKLIDEGKLNEEDFTSLGPIINQKHNIKSSNKKNTIFIAGGLSIQDIAWGYHLYKSAKNVGVGNVFNLWDS